MHEQDSSIDPIWPDIYDTQRPLDRDPYHIPLRFCTEVPSQLADSKIYIDAINSLHGLRRLRGIYQLSNLRLVGEDPEQFYDHGNFHTRYEHSLQVSRITESILIDNGFDEHVVKTGIVAALIHDKATPAGGDATKKLDPSNLHEEDHWLEMIDDKESQEFFSRYNIEPHEIDAIIHNEGILGRVLDVADKIAYTTEDAYQIGKYHISYPQQPIPDYVTEDEDEMFKAFRNSQNIGNIIKEVKITPTNDDIYFTNPDRLASLLKNRAYLSSNIYMHPYNQAQDKFFADLIAPMYSPHESDNTQLSPSVLRQITDWELLDEINNYWRPQTPFRNIRFMLQNFHPKTITTDSYEEAEGRAKELTDDSTKICMGITSTPVINPCTDWRVQVGDFFQRNGTNIQTVGQVLPYEAAHIQRIIDGIPRYSTAYYEKGNPEFDDLVERVYQEKNAA